jgi:hypothetical protein
LEIRNLGGTPSITHPTPLPCDSPKVVTRKAVPQVLAAPARVSAGAERRRWRRAEGGRAEAEKARDDDDDDAVVEADIAVAGLIVLFFRFEGEESLSDSLSESSAALSEWSRHEP